MTDADMCRNCKCMTDADMCRRRPISTFNYKDDNKNINFNIDGSHVACIGAGIIIGATAGIYIYKKYFK
jgi:hypothetical protein